jgi:hypothetical protein
VNDKQRIAKIKAACDKAEKSKIVIKTNVAGVAPGAKMWRKARCQSRGMCPLAAMLWQSKVESHEFHAAAAKLLETSTAWTRGFAYGFDYGTKIGPEGETWDGIQAGIEVYRWIATNKGRG